jgi:hypothetical protein
MLLAGHDLYGDLGVARIGECLDAPLQFSFPDYALSSATEAWYKTGTYGLFLRV